MREEIKNKRINLQFEVINDKFTISDLVESVDVCIWPELHHASDDVTNFFFKKS